MLIGDKRIVDGCVMMAKLASEAALCYNEALNMVVVWDACNITRPRYNVRGCTMSDSIPQKQCKVCKSFFPATPEFFHRNHTHKDGLVERCKECRNEKNTIRNRVYQRRPDIQEHRRTLHKVYYSRPEIRKHVLDYNKTYRSLPESKERYRHHTLHRIALKKSISGTYTPEQVLEQLKRQKFRCYYAACGHAKFKKIKGNYIYQIDHTFPISRVMGTNIPANDISYLVLTCPTCNQEKNNKFPWEWPEGGRLL